MKFLSHSMTQLKTDFSISASVAGLIVALVGMTSSAVIVFQAAASFGADPAQASSWLGSLCFGMGVLNIYFCLKYKTPILLAWSTPGAALLIAGAPGISLSEAMGAFVISSLLITISGATGLFEKVMSRIPIGLSAGLLAGVLINFSLKAFTDFNTQPILIAIMFFTYILSKKYYPHFAMLFVLLAGTLVAAGLNLLHFENVQLLLTQPQFTKPEFSLTTTIGLAIPLFIVTMASQNVTGISIMRSYGYENPISKILTKIGIVNLLTSCFGGFTINFAAITAAIAMGPESHRDKDKRYVAGIVSGVIYLVVGVTAGTVTSLFSAFPQELIAAVAGFALLGTVAVGLQKALSQDHEREAAFITFIISASGFKFLGIGAAFWSLVAGIAVQFILNKSLKPKIRG